MGCVRDERHPQEPFWLKYPEFYPVFFLKKAKINAAKYDHVCSCPKRTLSLTHRITTFGSEALPLLGAVEL